MAFQETAIDMISVENLSKKYGDFLAVDDISFSIKQNEVVALLGLNGAGKTTTLRMLTGFLAPTRGNIVVNDFNLLESPMQLKRQIGYMPENPALYLDMTVESFLKYMYRLRMYTDENEAQAVDRVLQKTNLDHRRTDLIGSLSAGYRKRVGLAQALVHGPPVLIFDEPISDLDPLQIIEIRNLLLELKKEHTILVSSHILSEVSRTADRYLFIHDGKLVAEETPDSLRKYLETAFSYSVQIKLAGTEATRLTAAVQEITGVSSVEITDTVNDVCSLIVNAGSDIRGAISRTIVENNFELLQIQEQEMNLEQLFMNLTRARAA